MTHLAALARDVREGFSRLPKQIPAQYLYDDLGSALFGWPADRTSIEFIFRVTTLLPLLGVITGFLPNIGAAFFVELRTSEHTT